MIFLCLFLFIEYSIVNKSSKKNRNNINNYLIKMFYISQQNKIEPLILLKTFIKNIKKLK